MFWNFGIGQRLNLRYYYFPTWANFGKDTTVNKVKLAQGITNEKAKHEFWKKNSPNKPAKARKNTLLTENKSNKFRIWLVNDKYLNKKRNYFVIWKLKT